MSGPAAYAGCAVGGAVLAVIGLLATRPDVPALVQVVVVVAAALLASPVLRFAQWRQQRDNAAGERFGNALLERLRRRRDGDAYWPGGPRVVLDPDALREAGAEATQQRRDAGPPPSAAP